MHYKTYVPKKTIKNSRWIHGFPSNPRPGCCTTTAPPPLPAPADRPGASPVPQRAAPRRCWRGSRRRRHPRCVGVALGRFQMDKSHFRVGGLGGLGGVSWSSEVAIGFEHFWTQLGTSIKNYWNILNLLSPGDIYSYHIWIYLGDSWGECKQKNQSISYSKISKLQLFAWTLTLPHQEWTLSTCQGPSDGHVRLLQRGWLQVGVKSIPRSLGWSCCDSQIWSDSPSLGDSEHRKSSPTLMDGPWPVLHKNVPWRNGWWRDASGTAGPAETLGWRSHCDYRTPPNVQREICPCRPVPPPVGQT